MDCGSIQHQAHKLAAKAKPGIVKIDGKIYTLVFDQIEWVYRVYQDGFLIVNFNSKRLSQAKRFLVDYLKS